MAHTVVLPVCSDDPRADVGNDVERFELSSDLSFDASEWTG